MGTELTMDVMMIRTTGSMIMTTVTTVVRREQGVVVVSLDFSVC